MDDHDHYDLVTLAKKLYDLKAKMYATRTTAQAIRQLGIDVTEIPDIGASGEAFELIESGRVSYVVYTGALRDDTMREYIALHRRALAKSIACLTSLDTANALADILKSRYNERNTELVDLCHMRARRSELRFAKMQCAGTDYIVIDNRDSQVSCAESLCVGACDRHFGVGGGRHCPDRTKRHRRREDAHVQPRRQSRRHGRAAVFCCVAKYLHDRGLAAGGEVTIEAGGGVKRVQLFLTDGKVTSARVDMGEVVYEPARVPVALPGSEVVDRLIEIGRRDFRVTCLSMGNPHCVTFVERVDALDLQVIGPLFENAEIFPERVNAGFARVVNERMIKLRVYERGNGETLACGTGACAAAAAAVKLGKCPRGRGDHR